jgi:hypothetical protein
MNLATREQGESSRERSGLLDLRAEKRQRHGLLMFGWRFIQSCKGNKRCTGLRRT